MLENGQEICTCKKKRCERFGRCEECIAHHAKMPKMTLPYCKRQLKGKTQPKEK